MGILTYLPQNHNINSSMTIKRTVRTKIKKGTSKKRKTPVRKKRNQKLNQTHNILRSTMQIPVDNLFDDISLHRYCCLDIDSPEKDTYRASLNEDNCTIGRTKNNTICIPMPNISGNHAVIKCNMEEYCIYDLDSTNGTFVNNVRISKCILRNLDQIRIGEARITFVHQKVRN